MAASLKNDRSEPREAAIDQAGALPDWQATATAAVAAVEAALEKPLRKAGESLYADLLYTVQDYLRENVLDNIQSDIDSAHRQAQHDRHRARNAEEDAARLRSALSRAYGSLRDYMHAAGPLDAGDAMLLVDIGFALHPNTRPRGVGGAIEAPLGAPDVSDTGPGSTS